MPNESERNMKDFSLRNDTRLPIRNDSAPELAALRADRSMLLVYGDGSVKEADRHVSLAGIDAPRPLSARWNCPRTSPSWAAT